MVWYKWHGKSWPGQTSKALLFKRRSIFSCYFLLLTFLSLSLTCGQGVDCYTANDGNYHPSIYHISWWVLLWSIHLFRPTCILEHMISAITFFYVGSIQNHNYYSIQNVSTRLIYHFCLYMYNSFIIFPTIQIRFNRHTFFLSHFQSLYVSLSHRLQFYDRASVNCHLVYSTTTWSTSHVV